MAAPSSAQTSPSHMAKKAPRIQPSIACGPPIAVTMSGMVMKGPTPIMSIRLRAVAWERESPRMSLESDFVISKSGNFVIIPDLNCLGFALSTHFKCKLRNFEITKLPDYFCPAASRFTYSRIAPGTPAGSCRKKAQEFQM